MQRLWRLRGESPSCSLVQARRRTCRLSRNEINVQGAGLELRHVKLSHRCFSSILASAIPAGNERKRRIAPYRDGQRKIGWTASRATERPFRPCLRAPGRGSVIRMYHVSQAKVRCRSSSTSRDRNSFRPFSSHLFRSRSLAKHPLPCFSHVLVGSSSRLLRPGCVSLYNHA